jgi:hypothetical protein
MMKKPIRLFLMLLITGLITGLLAGCAQNIRSHELDSAETMPSISYEAYLFVAGISERSRAVFLRHPDAEMMIEPASHEIFSTTATYAEAMTFMRMKRGMRLINTEVITYKGKPLGYLLTYDRPGINAEFIDTNLTERGGKIYFSARENTKADE